MVIVNVESESNELECKPNKILNEFVTISLLSFISIFGVLIRFFLIFIGNFSNFTSFNLIYSQIVGCFLMGIFLNYKNQIISIYSPFYIMLTTGLCGSITTFSTFMFEVFSAFANLNQPNLNRFNGFMNGFSMTIITIGMSLISFQFGKSISKLFQQSINSTEKSSAQTLNDSTRTYDVVSILLGISFYVGVIIFIIFGPKSYYYILFSLLFGPFGTLLRYYLSKHLNAILSSIPIGTLFANLLAVIIYSFTQILLEALPTTQQSYKEGINHAVLFGIQNGFCGCLSTISTLVVELTTLPPKQAYRYFIISYVMALLFLVLILGSYTWSR